MREMVGLAPDIETGPGSTADNPLSLAKLRIPRPPMSRMLCPRGPFDGDAAAVLHAQQSCRMEGEAGAPDLRSLPARPHDAD